MSCGFFDTVFIPLDVHHVWAIRMIPAELPAETRKVPSPGSMEELSLNKLLAASYCSHSHMRFGAEECDFGRLLSNYIPDMD